MKQVENDVNGNPKFQFAAKLLSVSEKVLANVNGTEYRVISVEFTDVKGTTQKASGIMYEKNYAHGVKVGETYSATATITAQGPLIVASHLDANADRPTADMFGVPTTQAATAPAVGTSVLTGEIHS